MNARKHRDYYYPRQARRWRSPYEAAGEGFVAFLLAATFLGVILAPFVLL